MRRILAVCGVAALLSACAGSEDPGEPAAEASEAPATAVPLAAGPPASWPGVAPCRRGEERALGSVERSYAAIAERSVTAVHRPGGPALHRFGVRNENGFATVFGILGAVIDERCEPVWYRVQLPRRPNGVEGYVPAEMVRLAAVTTWIEVDLSERRVDLLDGGEHVLRLVAAIGKPETPTPRGRFYVNQRLRALDPSGPYGPGGLGISAFSPVLTGWSQGGPIAIHGTNAPQTIGRAASSGCLRVANEAVERLFDLVPAGTPVVIRQ